MYYLGSDSIIYIYIYVYIHTTTMIYKQYIVWYNYTPWHRTLGCPGHQDGGPPAEGSTWPGERSWETGAGDEEWLSGWWYTCPSEQKSKSVGMMKFPMGK